jgi:hypothetical protein
MGRFVYFEAAGRMLRDHPLAGIGFESYALLYPRYRFDPYIPIHRIDLDTAALQQEIVHPTVRTNLPRGDRTPRSHQSEKPRN